MLYLLTFGLHGTIQYGKPFRLPSSGRVLLLVMTLTVTVLMLNKLIAQITSSWNRFIVRN